MIGVKDIDGFATADGDCAGASLLCESAMGSFATGVEDDRASVFW